MKISESVATGSKGQERRADIVLEVPLLNSKFRVTMTNAARVLKEIRKERKHDHRSYSMRAISKRLSRSNAWLSHIENGRADVPSDHRLDALLDIYGLKRKSFNERVRLYKQKVKPRIELHELIDRLDDDKIRQL